MRRKHRWNKANSFGWFQYGGTLKKEEEKPPEYQYDPDDGRFLSRDRQTAIGDASIFGQASDEPHPQTDIGTDEQGNPNVQLKNDKPYAFQQNDEWEAVLQLWEFKQQYVQTDEPDEIDNEEAH